MKKLLSLLAVVVLFLVYFVSFSFSSPPISWQPSARGGSFIVGEDTKSIPNIDKMYVATGASIQSNFHTKLSNYFQTETFPPKPDTVFSFQDNTGAVYSAVCNSGFSLIY